MNTKIFTHKFRLFALFLALPTFAQAETTDNTDYPINFDKEQIYNNTHNRRLNGIALKSADGNQSVNISDSPTVYTSLADQSFTARAGELVNATFNFSGNWMNGFVYLDQGRDGNFDAVLNADGTFDSTSDIMAFSYAETTLNSGVGYNSKGETVSVANVLQPPSFRIPENLPNGFYRMRYKVDWSAIDPGGRITETNHILTNGGAICDIRLNVHGETCKVCITNSAGGKLALNGEAITETEVAFGKALTFDLLTEDGYTFNAVRIKHGYNLDGEQFISSIKQYSEDIIPGFLAEDGKLTIPAQFIDGELRIEAFFDNTAVKYENYAWENINKTFSEEEMNTADCLVKKISATATKGGNTELLVNEELMPNSYRNLLYGKELSVHPGDQVTLKVFDKNDLELTGSDKPLKLYIDLNEDGHFSSGTFDADNLPLETSELVGLNKSGNAALTFNIHKLLPSGKYRARLVAGNDEEVNNPATATDFLINVHTGSFKFSVFTTHGSVHGNEVSGLPETLAYGTAQTLRPVAAAPGYEAEVMTIRHGHNLDGEQFIHGNRQWSEYTVAPETYILPADSVDGEVRVYVDFHPTDIDYTLVFCDEFNAADGSLPDSTKWIRCPRQSSTWNRWLSINDKEHAATGYINDGKFVALAIPNPYKEEDNVDMITGGIKSMGKFGFTYGKVECRAKNNPWRGNFPAIWMMPEDQSAGWPNCGEIDIWETIDAQNVSYHTIHSNWTYNLGHKGNPQSSFSKSAPQDTWHTYGFEWSATSLKWYVDGIHVGTYNKSTSSDALSQGQWPFDKDFHLMLNQSVGNGSWAANADISHTYRTDFDWIRVYQLEEQTNTSISSQTRQQSDIEISTSRGILRIYSAQPEQISIYDYSGKAVFTGHISGEKEIQLPSGIYIINSNKYLIP